MFFSAKIKSNQQVSLWFSCSDIAAVESDSISGIGPFQRPEDQLCRERHIACANYDQCVGYAASKLWPSFSCMGCRKTATGRWVESIIHFIGD